MDVTVEVGGWEHECCGLPIERDQLVDLGCVHITGAGGAVSFREVRHYPGAAFRVQGRVLNILVVRPGQPAQPVLRLPGGEALRGLATDDDGHLETPWTGEHLARGTDFNVVVDTVGATVEPGMG